MRLQFWHIVVIVLIIVILFGAKRLPDVASSVGQSLKIFKKEVSELRDDDEPAGGGPPAHGGSDVSPAPHTGTAPPDPPPPAGDDPGHPTPGSAGTYDR